MRRREKRESAVEVFALNFVSGSRYLGAYLGPQKELEAWVNPQVEAWAHRVRVLGKISQRHPQSAYDGLGILVQLEWKYLQRTVSRVVTLMGSIEEALRDKFFPTLFGGEEINANFRKILGHSVKNSSLGLPDPQFSAESAYNTSKADSGEMVDYLLGGSSFNYVGHRACVRRANLAARREKMYVDIGDLSRQKELTGGQERNRLHRETINGAWLRDLPHCINGMELYREEFRYNLRLGYGLMPQDNPAMVVVRSSRLSTPYHSQRVALFWSGMMTSQKSGVTLDPGPSSLVLLPTNLKSIVGQYSGRGPGQERVRTVEKPTTELIL